MTYGSPFSSARRRKSLGSLVAIEPWQALEACGQPTRTGAGLPRLAPFGNFATTDGFIALCGPMQEFAAGLFRAMGQPELIDDPRFATRDARVRNSSALDDLISPPGSAVPWHSSESP